MRTSIVIPSLIRHLPKWPLDRALGARFGSLVTEAWRRGLVTTGRAADLLDLDVESFRWRMQATGIEPEPADDMPFPGAARVG